MNTAMLMAVLWIFAVDAGAAAITKSYIFSNGGVVSASEMNTNFDQLFNEVNSKETRITSLEGTTSVWSILSGNAYRSTGRIGLGTNAPNSVFNIKQAAAGTDDLFRIDNAAGDLYAIQVDQYFRVNFWNGALMIGWDPNVATQALSSPSWADLYLTSGNNSAVAKNIILKPSGTGKVGINNTGPTAMLDIVNNNNADYVFSAKASAANGGNGVSVDAWGNAYFVAGLKITYNGTYSLPAVDGGGGDLLMSTSAASKNIYLMPFAGGRVGIGTTNPGYFMDVAGAVNASGGYTSISDGRLKTSVQPLADSLEKILRVQGVTFRWIDEKKYGSEEQIGVIAQDLEKIFPDLVKTGSNGLKAVNYQGLVAPTIEAIKTIHAGAEADRERISGLEKENTELRSKIQQLGDYLCSQNSAPAFCGR